MNTVKLAADILKIIHHSGYTGRIPLIYSFQNRQHQAQLPIKMYRYPNILLQHRWQTSISNPHFMLISQNKPKQSP